MEKYKEPQIYIVNNREITERLSQNYIVATGDLGVAKTDIVNIGLHFILKNVRPYAASCSEA